MYPSSQLGPVRADERQKAPAWQTAGCGCVPVKRRVDPGRNGRRNLALRHRFPDGGIWPTSLKNQAPTRNYSAPVVRPDLPGKPFGTVLPPSREGRAHPRAGGNPHRSRRQPARRRPGVGCAAFLRNSRRGCARQRLYPAGRLWCVDDKEGTGTDRIGRVFAAATRNQWIIRTGSSRPASI
jgi:hypothetical protein